MTASDAYIKLKDAIATVPMFDKKELLEDFLESVDYEYDLIAPTKRTTFLKLVQIKIGFEARKTLKDAKITTLSQLKEHLHALYNSGLTESTNKSQEESFRNGLLDTISIRLPATNDLNELMKEAIRIEKSLNIKREMRKR
ncbi:hypothetical protein TKK_0001669 [Trichogramma kaykai]